MDAYQGIVQEIEEILLDFLQYRRNKSKPVSSQPIALSSDDKESDVSIPAEIGKGWPYYKTVALPFLEDEANNTRTVTRQRASIGRTNQTTPVPYTEMLCGNIVRPLKPIVESVLSRHQHPRTARELRHLIDQVIAQAMSITEIADIMKVTEISAWGRVQLLQAVIELMITAHIEKTPHGDQMYM